MLRAINRSALVLAASTLATTAMSGLVVKELTAAHLPAAAFLRGTGR